jgi:hypothetical protein
MNRIENRDTASGAAKLFEDEVLELEPDIARSDLCGMVGEYVYYQQDDITRTDAQAIEETCLRK